YIEQAYFFRTFRERLDENMSAQEILRTIHEEILSTTKLPMALEFLSGEIELKGRISDGMALLSHYFTPFQTFVMKRAEDERSRFDQRIALEILAKEAEFRAENPSPAGMFIYQFECIARNQLGYDEGFRAMAADPVYDEPWREWINKCRMLLGTVDMSDLIYVRSEYAVQERRRKTGDPDYQSPHPILFGLKEGRIAKAHRGKDPLYMFAALQRHLGYPAVPRQKRKPDSLELHPLLEQRLQRIEQSIKVLQMEIKGDVDLSEFYVQKPDFKTMDDDEPPGEPNR
ncbi:MAG TPA: hypothetical protein EYP14_16365, partial [Planctomycetaceae bacterium]|nr:hypothetical protein [Planctomycetaceae bacterium]